MNWEAVKKSISHIEGLLGGGDSCGCWLYEAARSLSDDSSILEIGAYLGYSTSCLAFGCKDTRKHVYTIDTFCGNDTDFIREESFFGTWEANMRECRLLDYVTPLRGPSSSFYETWDKPIHLVFIDGCHDLEVVIGDFDAFYPHVVSGSCIALHDVPLSGDREAHPGVYRAWHEHIKLRLQNIDLYPVAHGWKA